MVNTNLRSGFVLSQAIAKQMIAQKIRGKMLFVTSLHADSPRNLPHYSAAKAGIIGACKALSLELAKRKITVNCIAPGLIDTGMTDMEPAAIDAVMSSIPLKRMGSAEEVAGLASYLMSDIAGYVTRQVISINGGMV